MNPQDILIWSIAVGERERGAVQGLSRSAAEAGLPGPIHVVTDADVPGCECYDWMELELENDFALLVYLKGAISAFPQQRLLFLSPWHRFYSFPRRMSALCARAPMHIPLEGLLEAHPLAEAIYGMPAMQASAIMKVCGLGWPHQFARPAFVMIRKAAVDLVFDLVQEFRYRARENGVQVGLALSLTYATQMLCADIEPHLARLRRDLWLPCEELEPEERDLLQSSQCTLQRSLRLLSLPSLVYFGESMTDPLFTSVTLPGS